MVGLYHIPLGQEYLMWMVSMKKIIYFSVYFLLFIIGFSLLNFANVLDIDTSSPSERVSKFIVMIIVLIAITRWGIRIYTLLTKDNNNVKQKNNSQ